MAIRPNRDERNLIHCYIRFNYGVECDKSLQAAYTFDLWDSRLMIIPSIG